MPSVKELRDRFAGCGGTNLPTQRHTEKNFLPIRNENIRYDANTLSFVSKGMRWSMSSMKKDKDSDAKDKEKEKLDKERHSRIVRSTVEVQKLRRKLAGSRFLSILDLADELENRRLEEDRQAIKRIARLRSEYKGVGGEQQLAEAESLEISHSKADDDARKKIELIRNGYLNPAFKDILDEAIQLELEYNTKDKKIADEINRLYLKYKSTPILSLLSHANQIAAERKARELEFLVKVELHKSRCMVVLGVESRVIVDEYKVLESCQKEEERLEAVIEANLLEGDGIVRHPKLSIATIVEAIKKLGVSKSADKSAAPAVSENKAPKKPEVSKTEAPQVEKNKSDVEHIAPREPEVPDVAEPQAEDKSDVEHTAPEKPQVSDMAIPEVEESKTDIEHVAHV